MAIKAGTDNRRNVIIAVVLFGVLAFLVYYQLLRSPSTPAPAPVASRPASPQTSTASPALATPSDATAAGPPAPAARKATVAGPGLGIDPSLHLEKLASSESIEYAGTGRNIFSADSAPVAVEVATAPARPSSVVPVYTPPPVPQPPAIDLHYFGYSANRDGKRQAFLLHGEDIFQASAGEIVNHRYKVVAVDAHSVQVTDLSYNNTQTLPLQGN